MDQTLSNVQRALTRFCLQTGQLALMLRTTGARAAQTVPVLMHTLGEIFSANVALIPTGCSRRAFGGCGLKRRPQRVFRCACC